MAIVPQHPDCPTHPTAPGVRTVPTLSRELQMHSQPALRALRPAPGSVYGARGGTGRAAWTPGARAAVEDDACGDADAGFDRLHEGFRASGGLLAADDLAGRVRPSHGQGVGLVARWIVERSVVSVDSLGSYWIPAFQFCPLSWTPHP